MAQREEDSGRQLKRESSHKGRREDRRMEPGLGMDRTCGFGAGIGGEEIWFVAQQS